MRKFYDVRQQEKLKLEQDLTEAGDEFDETGVKLKSAAKKDVSRLLKVPQMLPKLLLFVTDVVVTK